MALVRETDPAKPWEMGYAVIRNGSFDVSSNLTSGLTRVDVGFWRSRAHREADIAQGERLPPAAASKHYVISGLDLSRRDIYTTLADHPDFAGWTSDEPVGEQVPA